MIIVMQVGATQAHVEGVVGYLRDQGVEPIVLPGQDNIAIGVPATLDASQRISFEALIATLPGVSKVTQTSYPYKLASREWHRENHVVEVKGIRIGEGFVVMAGPCSVESSKQMRAAAEVVKESGAAILRGGAFKPRTSPYAFQGLAEEGLQILKQIGDEFGLVTVSEVMSPDMVEVVAVLLPDNNRIVVEPPAVLNCAMAGSFAGWLHDAAAPHVAKLGSTLIAVESYDSYECRPRNRMPGAKLSAHAHGDALDLRAFRLADGRRLELTDVNVDKALRVALHDTACQRFSTVLGPGADSHHEGHIHLDVIQRHSGYRICQWEVREPLPFPSLVAAAVPLPRPRPALVEAR